MTESYIRNMYPGGNTPVGFFSYYSYIIDRAKARKVYILKGGPGTGKSTLIRKVGLEFVKQELDIEFMHCSSDNNSLDGVSIPKLGIAMIDGTSPHIVDPVHPGAVDEIINLGQFWRGEGLSKSKADIISLNKEKKSHFESSYRYLKAASSLKENSEIIYEAALDRGQESQFTNELILSIFGTEPLANTLGRQRCLFASAITPKGFSNFLDSICAGNRVIRLCAPAGNCTERILEVLKNSAIIRGYDVETYFCPMSPEKIEHMVIPELSLSIVTGNEYHDIGHTNNENCTNHFINEFYSRNHLERFGDQLGYDRLYTEALLEQAIVYIAKAKASHHELEQHYIKNMDYEKLNKFQDGLMEEILSIAETT